jgi:hypothetical protein
VTSLLIGKPVVFTNRPLTTKDTLARGVLLFVRGLGNNSGTRYAILGPETVQQNNVERRKRFLVVTSGCLGITRSPSLIRFAVRRQSRQSESLKLVRITLPLLGELHN